MSHRHPPALWARVRRAWLLGQGNSAQLGRAHGMSKESVRRKALDEGWPPNGAALSDPALRAELVLEGLCDALSRSVAALSAEEGLADARERKALLMLHRQTLSLALSARAGCGPAAAAEGAAEAAPDLVSARNELNALLARWGGRAQVTVHAAPQKSNGAPERSF